jgi:hypothetical protein
MDLLRGLQKQLADLERRAVPRGIRAAEGFRNAGSPVASVRPLMNPVVATGLRGVGMTANLLSKGAVIPSLIEKTKEVFNPKDNIITTLRNFGTSVENQFAAPGQERRYVGSSPTAVRANRRLDASRPLNAIDTGNSGPTDWNPSANPSRVPTAPVLPPPTDGAADRAYQSAKAETAAMVATDPLMQQWSAAQKAKDYTTADQLGKQIWQNRYGGGLMGQPGGAIGSKNPLMDSTFVYQTGMSPGDIAKTITNPSDIPVSPGEAPYQTGDFGTRLGENGYDATKYGITPEMIEEIRKRQGVEEMKNRLLQQASTK